MYFREITFTAVFIFLTVLAASHVLDAQVSAQRMTHSRGDNEALILTLPSADVKTVEKLWIDWVREHYDVKTKDVRRGKGEMQSLNFSMPGVSPGAKVDMYSKVQKTGKEGSELMVWIATPDGYVSRGLDRSEYYEAEKVLMRFALTVSQAQMQNDVDGEEDKLKALEKELERLRKAHAGYEKDILNAEKAIEQARAKIERNLIDQEDKAREIEDQMQLVEAAKRRLNDY